VDFRRRWTPRPHCSAVELCGRPGGGPPAASNTGVDDSGRRCRRISEPSDVDLGPLTEIGKAITAGDLFIGKGVKLLTSKDELVARVMQAEAEVVEEAPVAAGPVEPEVIEKPKKEEEGEEEAGD
jgi:hypothetical protein